MKTKEYNHMELGLKVSFFTQNDNATVAVAYEGNKESFALHK
jgi:hypothetical protein